MNQSHMNQSHAIIAGSFSLAIVKEENNRQSDPTVSDPISNLELLDGFDYDAKSQSEPPCNLVLMINKSEVNEEANKNEQCNETCSGQNDKEAARKTVKESVISRKQKRNSGKQYITKTGKTVKQRCFKELQDCRKNCKDKITRDEQKAIFEDYWNLGSYSSRLLYLSGLIEVKPKKSERLEKTSQKVRNRTHTNYFYFNIHAFKINVCQKCFLNTLGETEQTVKTISKKKLDSPSGCISDLRGRHTPGSKLSDQKIQEIRDHINSFPCTENRNTKKRSVQKFLSSDLTLRKMHRMYIESHSPPISCTKYSEIFHSMGIKFKPQKKIVLKNNKVKN